DGNSAPIKRQRVSRACDQCRTAREKCDGIQPICFTCASSNRECSYTANPKKRGIQPGYIRTLELALAWTFKTVPGSEGVVSALLEEPKGRALLSGKDTEGSYKLHREWRRGTICKGIDRLLSGSDDVTKKESDSPEPQDEDQLDDTGIAPDIQTPNSVGGNLAGVPSGSLDGAPGANASAPTPARTSESVEAEKTRIAPGRRLHVPSNLWRLFDVYFAYTHCWFPIAEKQDILKISYSYPDEGLEMAANTPGSGDHAELWSILAVASVQEQAANPSTQHRPGDKSTMSPQAIYDTARNLLPSEQGAHELGHVKALLLLSLVNMAGGNSRPAWLQIGHAVRLANLLGLYKDQQRNGMFPSAEESNKRGKHVYLACFALDSLVSAHLGREPFLKREHINRVGLLNEDGLEEWHPWVGCPDFRPSSQNPAQYSRSPVHSLSTFNHLVRIMGVVNDVCVGNLDSNGASLYLQQWISSLPPAFKAVQSDLSTTAPTPTLFSLRLIYLWTTMAFAIPSVAPFDTVAESFLKFADVFGIAALLPIFSPLIALAGRSGAFEALSPEVRMRWTTALNTYRESWRRPEVASTGGNAVAEASLNRIHTAAGAHVSQSPTASTPKGPAYPSPVSHYPASSTAFSPPRYSMGGSLASPSSANLHAQNFAGMTQYTGSNAHNPVDTSSPNVMNFTQPLHIPSDSRDLTVQTTAQASSGGPTLYDGPGLERYNSAGSVDLDALFDELATLEGPGSLDSQPQFMQNLGFAPDTNLNDV
ncbi:hypothetical protein K490DRAFT_9630, partial [Saccharata proteae CBS 121410]